MFRQAENILLGPSEIIEYKEFQMRFEQYSYWNYVYSPINISQVNRCLVIF